MTAADGSNVKTTPPIRIGAPLASVMVAIGPVVEPGEDSTPTVILLVAVAVITDFQVQVSVHSQVVPVPLTVVQTLVDVPV